MQVDFYQLRAGDRDTVLPLLARKTLEAGERLLVLHDDADARTALDRALWTCEPVAFLAHGHADAPHAERQPILIGDAPRAANGARFVALADGRWRDEALGFARTFLLFDDATLAAARACWRDLKGHEGLVRNFWRQEDGRWARVA